MTQAQTTQPQLYDDCLARNIAYRVHAGESFTTLVRGEAKAAIAQVRDWYAFRAQVDTYVHTLAQGKAIGP